MQLILNDTSYTYLEGKSDYDVVDIRNLVVKPCYGCEKCTYTGRCILDDDMQALLYKIAESQRLIFLINPFLGSYSIQCKRILDRMAVLGNRLYAVEKGELCKRGFRTKMKEMQFIVVNDITDEEYQIFQKLVKETSILLGMPISSYRKDEVIWMES